MPDEPSPETIARMAAIGWTYEELPNAGQVVDYVCNDGVPLRQRKEMGRILILDVDGRLEYEYVPAGCQPDDEIVHAANYVCVREEDQ